MGTVSAMLLLTLAAEGPPASSEPLTPDELQIAVAALEEQRSRLRSFQVRYRLRQEVAPGVDSLGAKPSVGEYTTEWSWRSGSAHFLCTGDQHRKEWWYDGEKAYAWQYKRKEPSKLQSVWIYHWRPERALNDDLALVTGFGGPNFELGLIAPVKSAMRDRSLSGEKTERGWKLALVTQHANRPSDHITVVLDPDHDFRLLSWKITHEDWPDIHRFVVDEFQSVKDELDGSAIWYPLRAHMEQLVITRLEVDSVRINLDLPDTEFTPPEMEFGTQVNEMIVPGQIARTYLVGGPDAEEQRLTALVEVARRELDHQEREGVAVDASPDTAANPLPWIISGALLLVLAGFLYWRRAAAVSR